MEADLNRWLERQPAPIILLISGCLELIISGVDYWITVDLAMSTFYLAPIALAAWYTDRWKGAGVAIASGLLWYVSDTHAKTYPFAGLAYWNMGMRLISFLLVSHLLGSLRIAYRREQLWARLDDLTGVMNRRYFIQQLDAEISRASRYQLPLTLAYLDLDNFKQVNDRLGHKAGDEVLQRVAAQIRASLRQTDLIARLGGDEFAILLPQTTLESGQQVLTRLHHTLMAQDEIAAWQISFSMGAVTYLGSPSMPSSSSDLLRFADNLMYTVKTTGKNQVHCKMLDECVG